MASSLKLIGWALKPSLYIRGRESSWLIQELDLDVYSPGEIPTDPLPTRVMVWTLDKPSEWKQAVNADAIITNRPAAALEYFC